MYRKSKIVLALFSVSLYLIPGCDILKIFFAKFSHNPNITYDLQHLCPWVQCTIQEKLLTGTLWHHTVES